MENVQQNTQKPLADLSPNKPPSPTKMDNSAEYKQMLQSKLSGGDKQGTYISPSDGILSPTTQKLSTLKGKRFASAGKPLSLFAKTSKSTASSQEKPSGFQDIKNNVGSK